MDTTTPSGADGAAPPPPPVAHSSSLEVPLSHSGEIIELDLEEMFSPHQTPQDSIDQLDEVVNMLTRERVKVNLWTRFIQECWTRGRYATALHYADKGLDAIRGYLPSSPSSQSPLYLLKASYHLSLSRLAPKTRLQTPRTTPLALPKDPHHPESLHAQEVYPGLNRGGRSTRQVMGKEDYWYRVEKDLDRVRELERGNNNNKVERDLRAALAMARGKLEESNRLFEQILLEEPTHLMALTGRARILFSKLSFRPALKIYQQILTLQPTFLPDPRVGIGLCFYFLGDREKARKAWERSISINPTQSTSAQTLLGLLHLNRSRDPMLPGGSKNRLKAYELGIGLVQDAFKRDNTLAACMGPLGNHLLIQNKNGQGVQQAMKLFERSLQFSETRLLIAESHFNLARSLDAQDPGGYSNTGDALTEYQRAVEANPDMVIAHLGVGGCYIRTEQFPAAINAFETLLRKHPQTVEALVSLASIHTHLAFTFHSVSDSAQSRKAAKESYEQVLRIFAQGKGGGGSGDQEGGGGGGEVKKEIAKSERIRQLANDREMFVEMARLWSDEVGVERSLKLWQEARRIQVETLLDELPNLDELDDEAYQGELEKVERRVDARVRNNIGVLLFNKKSWDASMGHFELAFETIGKEFAEKEGGGELDGGETDAVLTMVTFNLACVYEKLGMKDKAREGWENVLRGHPEFVDAKARLALLELSGAGKKDQASWDRAHVHLKEALTSQPHSPELRALYTYFLFETFQHRQARDFARSTLKEVSRHDLYALCASGIISYLEARENKQDSKEAVRERQARYLRSAEFFDKALQLDSMCTIAAQGLAIGLAEGALGNSNDGSSSTTTAAANGSSSATALTDAQSRQRNARDALLILTKVKESINDASVYVNIGHCHIARDEFERAAENYTTASKRYLEDKSSTVLWYLARAWYFKALKESSFVDLEKAIHVGQQATDLYPTDLSNIFNMAVLKQKAIEILYGKSNETRTSVQLRKGFEYLESSQSLFDELVKNQTAQTPYQKDFPRLRSSYGRSLLGRFQAILEQQLAYEETEAGKINQARQAREEARNRQLAEEAKKDAERQRQNEALAEQRKKMREDANAAWASMSKDFVDSDEEGEKKKKGTGGGKKRKATKLKGGEEAEASSTDEEGNEKPAKKKKAKKEKKPKKAKGGSRAMEEDDPDDEDAPIRAPGRKRTGKSRGNNLIKSNEFVEDSEEDE